MTSCSFSLGFCFVLFSSDLRRIFLMVIQFFWVHLPLRALLLVPWTSPWSPGSLVCYSPSFSPLRSFSGHCSQDCYQPSHPVPVLTYSGEKVSRAPHWVGQSSTWIKKLSRIYSRNLTTFLHCAMMSTHHDVRVVQDPPWEAGTVIRGLLPVFLRRALFTLSSWLGSP